MISYPAIDLLSIIGSILSSGPPPYSSVFISRPALTGHGSVQGGVDVGGRIGSSVAGCNGAAHEIRLFPTGFPIHFAQLHVRPHRV